MSCTTKVEDLPGILTHNPQQSSQHRWCVYVCHVAFGVIATKDIFHYEVLPFRFIVA